MQPGFPPPSPHPQKKKTKKKTNCENLFPRSLFFSAPNDPCRVGGVGGGGKLPKLASCIKAKRKLLNITAANL